MASSNLELAEWGGRRNADTGMLMTHADFDAIGDAPLQTLCNLLAILFTDTENARPISGFPREEEATEHCRVSATSDLGYSVATGFGMLFDSTKISEGDFTPNSYRPIVVGTALTGSLSAHHATLPRIDVLSLTPAYVADAAASRNLKDPGTGVVSSTSVAQRLRFGATLVVTAGTPGATPAVPATPTGHVAIARARVPATSGAAVYEDVRPVLEIGHLLKGAPPRYAVGDFVPLGGASALEVTESATPAMSVLVNRGRATIAGVTRNYPQETLVVTAADPTNPRIDRVIAKEDGTLAVTAGTPAGIPAAPALIADAISLALISVPATDTAITNSQITDDREREPYHGTTHIKAGTINHDRMDIRTIGVKLTAGAQVGDTIPIDIDVVYPDGTAASEDLLCVFCCEVHRHINAEAVAAEFDGLTGDVKHWSIPSTAADVDNIIVPETNVTPALDGTEGPFVGYADRMYFTIDDETQTAEISIRQRAAGSPQTQCVVQVYAVGRSGTNNIVPGERGTVSIKFL